MAITVFRYRPMLVVCFILCTCMAAHAQNVGASLNQASADVVRYVPVIQKLCYALAGTLSIVAAAAVYIKMSNGQDDYRRSATVCVLSCVFLVASATALPAFFGLDVTQGGQINGSITIKPGGTIDGGGADSAPETPSQPSVKPGSNVWENGGDGTYIGYLIADDGTKVPYASVTTIHKNMPGAYIKIGIAPDGTYRYYVGEGDNILWDTTTAVPMGGKSHYPTGDRLGLAEDGSYRWYNVGTDGTKVWGNKINQSVFEGANENLRYEVTDSGPKAYAIADDGTKHYVAQAHNNIHIQREAQLGQKSPGVYDYYVIADNGQKVWGGNKNNIAIGAATTQVGKYQDGTYHYYAIADDGTKIWGRPVTSISTI